VFLQDDDVQASVVDGLLRRLEGLKAKFGQQQSLFEDLYQVLAPTAPSDGLMIVSCGSYDGAAREMTRRKMSMCTIRTMAITRIGLT
jgi:hypothetical protein